MIRFPNHLVLLFNPKLDDGTVDRRPPES